MCSDVDIQKAEKDKQKKELEIMLMWGKFFFDLILDGEIFTHLKKKRYLIRMVKRTFNSFIY